VNLGDYDALSFDCYGTLIDWETGLSSILAPWAREAGLELTDEELLVAYANNEAHVEREHPTALYPTILAESFRRIGASLGRCRRGRRSPTLRTRWRRWPTTTS
jgi:2-haloacid dehalogenase